MYYKKVHAFFFKKNSFTPQLPQVVTSDNQLLRALRCKAGSPLVDHHTRRRGVALVLRGRAAYTQQTQRHQAERWVLAHPLEPPPQQRVSVVPTQRRIGAGASSKDRNSELLGTRNSKSRQNSELGTLAAETISE